MTVLAKVPWRSQRAYDRSIITRLELLGFTNSSVDASSPAEFGRCMAQRNLHFQDARSKLSYFVVTILTGGAMLLRHLTIENFRGIEELSIDFDKTTVLVGENNTGKTTVLQALRFALDKVKSRKNCAFDPFDFHLPSETSDPALSKPILITLKFREDKVDEWDADLLRALGDIISERDDEIREITLRVRCQYDAASNEYIQDWDFLDSSSNPLASKGAKQQSTLATLQQIRPLFYLSALRDAVREFSPNSSFWGPFLRSNNLDEKTKSGLELSLADINDKIIASHETLSNVKAELSRVTQLVSVGTNDAVRIDAVPGRLFDMLSRAQVSISATTGAKLPIARHGEGTQSLSVLLLFDAFVKSRLKNAYDRLAEPIVALEEPEAHLHPSAVRALWNTISALEGQKVIATHSGDLLAEVPIAAVRRFTRTNGKVEIRKLNTGTLNPEELRKLNYHVRASRGELFFAKLWLLGEGETEFCVLSEAAKLLGYDLERHGIRFVPFANVGVEMLVKVANDFGIEWHCVSDGDQQGASDVTNARRHLGSRVDTLHVTPLPYSCMEVLLCHRGYGSYYEALLTHQTRPKVTVPPSDPLYWEQVYKAVKNSKSKPQVALQVMAEIARRGERHIPEEIKTILDKVMHLVGAQPFSTPVSNDEVEAGQNAVSASLDAPTVDNRNLEPVS